jgi:hypothetical protein
MHLHADEVESEDELTPAEIEWIGQLQRIVDQEELEALQQSACERAASLREQLVEAEEAEARRRSTGWSENPGREPRAAVT